LSRGRLATARRKSLVLDLLSQGDTLAQVRTALGINRVTVYRWRQYDQAFATAYSDAMEAGTDLIEQEARRRAVEGYDRPVFQGGGLAGLERVYSDMLLALLLRGRRPEVFRETTSRTAMTTSISIRGGDCPPTTLIVTETCMWERFAMLRMLSSAYRAAPLTSSPHPSTGP